MTLPGVDYAWSHPGGAALKAAGKKFACRYLSSDHSKNLTRSEANDLAAHGISSVVVWENAANRALAGHAAGAADAKTAASQAASAGMPADRPIYFAVDFDATPGQQDEINAYLDGAASVLGRQRVGIYGGYYPVKRALDAGKATWAWQTIAWSGGQWDKRAHIRQGAQKTIGGVGCDLNTAMVADYGQWTPGQTPSPHIEPETTDMPKYVNLGVTKPYTLHPGGGWDAVEFDAEWDDQTGDHAKGGSQFVQGAALFTGTLWLSLAGLGVGEVVQARMSEVDAHGKYIHDHPASEVVGTSGGTFAAIPLSGNLVDGRGMRIRLTSQAKKPVTVSGVSLRVFVWN